MDAYWYRLASSPIWSLGCLRREACPILTYIHIHSNNHILFSLLPQLEIHTSYYTNMKFTAFIASLAILGSEAFAPGVGNARSSTGELLVDTTYSYL